MNLLWRKGDTILWHKKFLKIFIFKAELNLVQWDDILYCSGLDKKVDLLTYNVNLFNRHVPLQRVCGITWPRLTDCLKVILNEKNKALQKFQKLKTINAWNDYKRLRNFDVLPSAGKGLDTCIIWRGNLIVKNSGMLFIPLK